MKHIRLNLKHFFLTCLLICGSFALGQVQFLAESKQTQVEVNKPFNIEFYILVEGQNSYTIDEQIQLPDFDPFHKFGTMSMNTSYFNGSYVQKVGQMIQLIAEETGEFTIGSATVKISGKTYKTQPIQITVVEKRKPIQKPNNSRLEGAFLVTELSKTDPYFNESTILSVKLYARDFNLLERKTNFEAPKFKNFIFKKIEPSGNLYKQERVNGRVYVVEELARYVIFPRKHGNLEIEPFHVDLVISNYLNSQRARLVSDPIIVKAKKLPNSAPKGFGGAVGDFTMQLDVDKSDLSSNESVSLNLELKGTGNLNMIDLPELELPEEIEVYAPKKHENFTGKVSGLRGKITNEYILVPQYGGKYTIEPIKFSYFNPKIEKYETIETKPIELTVKGDLSPSKIAKNKVRKDSTKLVVSDSVRLIENDIEEIRDGNIAESSFNSSEKKESKIKEDLQKKEDSSLWVWTASGASALFLLFLILWLEKRHKRESPKRAENLTKSVRKKRSEVRLLIQELKTMTANPNSSEFYSKLELLLVDVGMYFTQINQAEFTPYTVAKKMQEKQKEKTVEEWKSLLLEAKENQYASVINGSIDLIEKVTKTEDLLDDMFKDHYF